ncbi:UNVERIFIED_CONTAM: Phenylalanine--tRNA ligase, chloroplastic/mitochondrial [Sesamum angustifolium]|uniref:phenylalanine--tRNA ligase n=1 Tax=Sesamum angustifolium TaxID=2727405 RepID=A0AAW2PCH4_9LAMI
MPSTLLSLWLSVTDPSNVVYIESEEQFNDSLRKYSTSLQFGAGPEGLGSALSKLNVHAVSHSHRDAHRQPQPLRSGLVPMAISFANATIFSKPSLFLQRSTLAFCLRFSSFSTSSATVQFHAHKKWRQPVASSLVELGGLKISREGFLGQFLAWNNFDDVLVPADHISRSYNDTYYVDSQTVLRCHTSAHQAELLSKGHTHFLVTGDVYRRDSIDSTHYPVFHQMEGVRVFAPADWDGSGTDATSYAAEDLKKCLEGLARHLFGGVEMRWIDTYFPFTSPSFELEIFFQEKWLEVLGCGVMEQEILKRSDRMDNVAWAFGLGLERLAMVLFDIPDIRLFWTMDERFTSQYPPCYKDMSFWISDSFTENNLCEVVRGIAGDLVEEVKLIDNFTNKKGMTSHCYRIAYRSMERSLTDEEINDLQWKVREQVESKLKVVLR